MRTLKSLFSLDTESDSNSVLDFPNLLRIYNEACNANFIINEDYSEEEAKRTVNIYSILSENESIHRALSNPEIRQNIEKLEDEQELINTLSNSVSSKFTKLVPNFAQQMLEVVEKVERWDESVRSLQSTLSHNKSMASRILNRGLIWKKREKMSSYLKLLRQVKDESFCESGDLAELSLKIERLSNELTVGDSNFSKKIASFLQEKLDKKEKELFDSVKSSLLSETEESSVIDHFNVFESQKALQGKSKILHNFDFEKTVNEIAFEVISQDDFISTTCHLLQKIEKIKQTIPNLDLNLLLEKALQRITSQSPETQIKDLHDLLTQLSLKTDFSSLLQTYTQKVLNSSNSKLIHSLLLSSDRFTDSSSFCSYFKQISQECVANQQKFANFFANSNASQLQRTPYIEISLLYMLFEPESCDLSLQRNLICEHSYINSKLSMLKSKALIGHSLFVRSLKESRAKFELSDSALIKDLSELSSKARHQVFAKPDNRYITLTSVVRHALDIKDCWDFLSCSTKSFPSPLTDEEFHRLVFDFISAQLNRSDFFKSTKETIDYFANQLNLKEESLWLVERIIDYSSRETKEKIEFISMYFGKNQNLEKRLLQLVHSQAKAELLLLLCDPEITLTKEQVITASTSFKEKTEHLQGNSRDDLAAFEATVSSIFTNLLDESKADVEGLACLRERWGLNVTAVVEKISLLTCRGKNQMVGESIVSNGLESFLEV